MSQPTATQAVIWAAAELVRAFGEPTHAAHLLGTWGITEDDMHKADEFDLLALKESSVYMDDGHWRG